MTGDGRRTLSATMWSSSGYYGSRVLSLLTTLVLARLLTPEQFGIAGYAFVVVTFLDVLRDLGIGAAVVYSDDEDVADTAFWTGLLIGIGAYAVTWLLAPGIADFFNDERATDVVRVLALTFPFYALGNIHDALLVRQLAFRRRLVPELSIGGSRALVGIVLALLGAGAWSLVGAQVLALAVGAAAFWLVHPWRPSRRFSLSKAVALLRYGGAMVFLNLVGKLLMNADYLFVGRYLGTQALGIYTLAFRVPELLIVDFCSAIGRVVFPAYARVRGDAAGVAAGLLAVTRYVALVTVPLGLSLACLAEPFVLTVFGRPWEAAIDITRAIAIYTMLIALTYNIGDIYKAVGRLGLLTALALLRAAVLLPALWWAATKTGSLESIAWTHVAVAAVLAIVELEIAVRAIGITRCALAEALRPAASAGVVLVAATAVALALVAHLPAPVQLVVGAAVALTAYVAALAWRHPEVVTDARRLLATAPEEVVR